MLNKRDKLKKEKSQVGIIDYISCVLTVLSIIVFISLMMMNTYWYMLGFIIYMVTLIVNCIGIFKGRTVLNIVLLIMTLLCLAFFTTPLMFAS